MMNAAAGLVGGSQVLTAQSPPDATATDAAGKDGDFTSVLAATGAAEPEMKQPDGTQSAAMLALLAGLLGVAGRQAEAPASESEGADITGDGLAAGIETSEQTAAVTGAPASNMATPLPTPPLGLMRALGATTAVGEGGAVAAEGDAVLAGLPLDAAASAQAQDSVAKDDRVMGTWLERVAAHAGTADTESRLTDGPNLYTNTRDAVATTAGAASSSPEVVRTAVGSPRWANELGSRLVMMSVRGQQEGSLSLTPEHLGPLEVRISVSQDTTNIWFGAQHADTRAALTEAIPRLREMLAASGLALGQAGVSQDMPRQEARRSEFAAITGADNSAAAETAPVALAVRRVRAALLDAWA